jgi:hypothetical protein
MTGMFFKFSEPICQDSDHCGQVYAISAPPDIMISFSKFGPTGKKYMIKKGSMSFY